MFLSSSLHTLYTLFLLLTALKWSLYLFFPLFYKCGHITDVLYLSSQLGLVFPREDSATCSPLITYSVKTLFLTWTHRHTDTRVHWFDLHFPPSGVIVHGCMRFPGPQTQTDMGRGGGGLRGDGRMDGQKRGDPGKKRRAGAGCYNNCRFMVQWLFLQSTRLLSV